LNKDKNKEEAERKKENEKEKKLQRSETFISSEESYYFKLVVDDT